MSGCGNCGDGEGVTLCADVVGADHTHSRAHDDLTPRAVHAPPVRCLRRQPAAEELQIGDRVICPDGHDAVVTRKARGRYETDCGEHGHTWWPRRRPAEGDGIGDPT